MANLERKLADDGKYEEFKQRIEKIADKPWEEYRNDFYFAQDDIVKVLSDMGCMSEESARNWAEMATNNPNYDIAIEDFAKLVKSYIEKKGKVWIIVTSQQDIDSVTKVKGNDFSKIQGRFDTRLALSSANVDEVIRKRILEKNEISRQSLSLLYDEKETVIKNLIIFNDGIDKKLFSSRDNFSADYPFVPYQFNLLGDVLTAVRLHSSSGKHLSEGERSMLAMFKESAMRVMNQQPGTLIPFHLFYDTLGKFLDSSHSSVIIKALANEKLNPENKDDCFDVNVLKVLFLIKYVNQIKPNIENITSLMVSNVDEDRLSLKEKVEEALNRLISQMLVQKNGDIYVFLTNEEQEINKAIEQQGQNIDNNEIIAKVSELVFDDLYGESKYRFSKFSGRYQFAFNQYVDNRPHKANQNNELTLKILTSYSDELASDNSEQTLRFTSMQNPKSIFVVLPEDTDYLDELRSALSIENFLRLGAGGSISKYPQIKEAKQIELRERYDRAKQYLKDSLEKADIYLNSDKLTSQTRDIKNRINDAMGKLIEQVYHKLSYIDSPMGESDIRNLLSSDPQTLTLEGMGNSKNQLALDDVLQYIGTNSTRHSKTSLKSLYVRFMKDPYGFVEADVQWLVAKLFKSGEIDFYVNNERITTANKSKEEIIGYITSKKYKETLMLDRKEKASEKQKKTVKDVMKEVFHASAVGEEDELIKAFKDKAGEFKTKLEKLEINFNNQPKYPGKDVVLNGKELMQKVLATRFSTEFFALVEKNREDFLDFSEDFEPVEAFFKGEQKKHFDEAVKQTGIYEKSRTFIEDKELEGVAEQIQNILNMPKPYREIYKLPELNGKFSALNKAMLDKQLVPILEIVKDEKSRVLEETCLKNCKDEFNSRAEKAFTELEEKAKNCQNVAELQTIRMEADFLKNRFINDIGSFIAKKEADSDYKTAFNYVVEKVAYTWFNRLIAIRFMEVNDYLPSRIRVLSSENTNKTEPDIVTSPFDTDLEFTPEEQDRILRLKDENKLDELFRWLFVKQCYKLNEVLPYLFDSTEKDKNDYTELLLTISFTDKDGVLWHLTHDISEDDFNVEKEGQIEIIGWLYQYYNTEPKDAVFTDLKKNIKITKDKIPAATQLFTPDWIVRYMVENSLGRLWVEGHHNNDLKANWKYYLEEAEQEPEVKEQLAKIREEYAKIRPEDIKVIENFTTSLIRVAAA